MKIKTYLRLGVALGLSAFISLAAQAQDGPSGGPGRPGGPPRGHRHHPPSPLIQVLDTNTNGVLEAAEIANASAALKSLDKNGDGKLTADELMPQLGGGTNQFGLQRPPAGKHPIPPLIAALDTNGDGELDDSEIANASAALLTLDTNGDGQLTPDELRPKGPGPQAHHQGPPGAPPLDDGPRSGGPEASGDQ